jgi:hypothetical protein
VVGCSVGDVCYFSSSDMSIRPGGESLLLRSTCKNCGVYVPLDADLIDKQLSDKIFKRNLILNLGACALQESVLNSVQ